MDSSLTVRPREGVNRAQHDRASVTRTELSPSQSVTAANAMSANRGGQGAAELLPRGPAIDAQGEEAIRQAREEEERRKRRRVTEAALSRMRAYRPASSEDESATEPPHADIAV